MKIQVEVDFDAMLDSGEITPDVLIDSLLGDLHWLSESITTRDVLRLEEAVGYLKKEKNL
jgi:hypothetical protein